MEIFLIILGLIYLIVASIQDLRKREVWNWLSFSLIAFALAYRAFYAVVNLDIMFFVYGLIGLLMFVGLGYLFYYARVFAGGDAKLLMAMGVVLPVSGFLFYNLIIFGIFIMLLLFAGSLWGLGWSFVLVLRNKKNFLSEFSKQIDKYKKFVWVLLIFSLLLISAPIILNDIIFALFPIIVFLLPLLYVYGKTIENSCMIAELKASQLTVGDWLYEKVKIGKKTIKPYWEGLSEDEVKLLRKYKGKIKIKQGIPFVPGFLIAFIFLLYINYRFY